MNYTPFKGVQTEFMTWPMGGIAGGGALRFGLII